jgi:hypothetical protein
MLETKLFQATCCPGFSCPGVGWTTAGWTKVSTTSIRGYDQNSFRISHGLTGPLPFSIKEKQPMLLLLPSNILGSSRNVGWNRVCPGMLSPILRLTITSQARHINVQRDGLDNMNSGYFLAKKFHQIKSNHPYLSSCGRPLALIHPAVHRSQPCFNLDRCP